MTAKPRIIAAISILVVASWMILLASAFVVLEVVMPISVPPSSSYPVLLSYALLKAVFGGVVLGVWLYSFYLLRDSYARFTGLTETPSASASRQTHDESRTV
jgi:uncharacterized membrane protein